MGSGLKIACISDTHGRDGWGIPECDVFVHAGDLTTGGTVEETLFRLGQIRGGMPRGASLVIVPGNHDAAFQDHLPRIMEVLRNHASWGPCHILIDEVVEIEGRRFYGSPWTPPFHDWSFMKEEDDLADLYRASMPSRIDLLITHGPPKGILDPGYEVAFADSLALLRAVGERKIGHHVFGHLHGAGGQTVEMGGTQFYNVAACNEAYKLVNGCRMIEL